MGRVRRRVAGCVGAAAVCAAAYSGTVTAGAQAPATARMAPVPTPHAPLPSDLSLYWLVPPPSGRPASRQTTNPGLRALARGSDLIARQDFAAALPLVSSPEALASSRGEYARYYTGIAQAGLNRLEDALLTFSLLAARDLDGALKELVPLKMAEVALTLGVAERAEGALAELTREKLANPADVWLMRARVEEAVGHREHALESFRRLYFDYPMSPQSLAAREGMARFETPDTEQPDAQARGVARAERLFTARRWADAKASFGALAERASAIDRDLIALRLAECEYNLGNRRGAREALRPLFESSAYGAEARYYYLTATRALGDRASYVPLVRELVRDHPGSPWAADALNGLATHYITADEDDAADRVLRELLQAHPTSRHSERAAWKVGWNSYRNAKYAEAAEIFDTAAAQFPRADLRPSWVYWAGQAYERLDDRSNATARYRLAVLDYRNSYYGRLAAARLTARREAAVTARIAPAPPAASISAVLSTESVIRDLIGAVMYGDALREVQYAQSVWGDSSPLQATAAWIRHQQGFTLTADERFGAIRGAITAMRRAYPQFMAAGGEGIPPDVLRVIFPLDYWPLITKYSGLHNLDPYLVAALMAQESTFTAEIRSHANAYGLMQIIPSTGRIYARKLGIKPFSVQSLRHPETNVKIGTEYLKDLIARFGGAHFALASYNAGEGRVARWKALRPEATQDEFIEDIPFPETQGYVKRILGTAEDYRFLYGRGMLDPLTGTVATALPDAAAPSQAATPAGAAGRLAARSTAPRTPR